jgi:hypothetical protein
MIVDFERLRAHNFQVPYQKAPSRYEGNGKERLFGKEIVCF